MPKRGLLKLLLSIILGSPVFCNQTNLIIKQIDSYNELTQAWVTSITQDYIGFMWFGTHDGVYRYDGYELKVYQSIAGNQFTLPGNNVREIYEDSNKNLWVTTSRGVSLYDRNRDCFIHHSTWPGNNFADVAEDASGNTYFGSFTGFFQYLPDSQIFKQYIQYPDSSDINNGHQEVYVTDDNRIILNGPYGLSEFNKESEQFIEVINAPLPFDGDAINCIIQDYKGAFWFGTRDYGLICYSQLESEAYKRLNFDRDHFLSDGTILSLIQSSDSVLWIGTENHGLVLLDLVEYYAGNLDINNIKNEKSDLKLSNNSVYSIYEDEQKNIWIGTYSGLNLYSSYFTDFNFFKGIVDHDYDIGNDIINTFLENDEEIWIGTENGIRVYNRENKSIVYHKHDPNNKYSLGSDAVWAFEKDRHGNIWVGTWGGGLNRYVPSTRRFIQKTNLEEDQNSISSNNIFSILEDENGLLWLGTMGGGLNSYDPVNNIFRCYKNNNLDPSSISSDWVRQLLIDSKNRFWVLTYNAVSLFDREKETFANFYSDKSDPSSISDNGAIVIFEDSRENIWLGTESGLNLFDPVDSSFTQYLTSDGLPSNVIQSILEDDDENLWISTYMGISKFVNAVNLPDHPEFVNFGVSDGLQGNKFNRRSALKTSDNYLIFGGNDGLNSFDPRAIRKSEFIPKMAITKAIILNKIEVSPESEEAYIEQHISLTDEIRLKHKHSAFTLYYTSFDFLMPEKNQYAYKLEGFEDEWNYVGNNRSATYTNLDPGKYVFKIKAANSSGLWMDEGKALKIIILPPWYRTFWAYTLYFIVLLFSFLVYRNFIVARTTLQHKLALKETEKEKLDQLNKMKTRFFTNISHEFRTPLTLIINPLETLLSDINILPSIKQQLSVVQVNARRLLRLINQLLDISKIETDHLDLKVSEGDVVYFIKEITALFRWPASQHNIDIVFSSNKDSCNGFFDGDKIEKICYNLISNALKYTPDGGKIEISIEIGSSDNKVEDGFMELSIHDSGIGIRKEEQDKIFEQFYRGDKIKYQNKSGFGIGLAVVNGLVSAYHGTIDIDSKEEEGTEFKILLPLSRKFFEEAEIETIYGTEKSITLDVYDLEQGIFLSENQELESEKLISELDDKRATLLLVEDDKDLRSHLKRQFSDYLIMEAENGEVALSKLNEHHPELIVSDVRMPKMDGFEFCKRIKENENTSHIPLILLTAKATALDKFEGLSIGADAYITKPFDTKILKTTIENLIESRKQLKEKYSKNFALEPSEISITSVDEKFFHKAITIAEEHIADPDYSVEMFSKEIGMSRSHLHRKFVGLAGVSPSGFIRKLRMKRAAQLLTKGQLTVSEILYEVGIKSRSYFIKSFKEQYGMSPTDYINKFKEGKNNHNIV